MSITRYPLTIRKRNNLTGLLNLNAAGLRATATIQVEVDNNLGGGNIDRENKGVSAVDVGCTGFFRGNRLGVVLAKKGFRRYGRHTGIVRLPIMAMPAARVAGYLSRISDSHVCSCSAGCLSLRSSNRRNLDVGPLGNLIGRNGVGAVLAGNLRGLVGVCHGDAL